MMKKERPYAWTVDILRRANLRPTCQRMGLVKLLFGSGNRHIYAESLFNEAKKNGINLSLATVYNTLNQFKEVGLLQEILTGGGRTYFDTNLTPHFHIYYEKDGKVEDISEEDLSVQISPNLLSRLKTAAVEVVVRVS